MWAALVSLAIFLGLVLSGAGPTRAAPSDAERCLEFAPNQAEAASPYCVQAIKGRHQLSLEQLAEVLYWSGLMRLDQFSYTRGIPTDGTYFLDLRKAKPDDYRSSLGLALVFLKQREFDQSLEESKQALGRTTPNDAETIAFIHAVRGAALAGKADEARWAKAPDPSVTDGLESQAIAELDQSIELQPSVFALIVRSELYSAKKDYTLALADAEQAIKIAPADKTLLGARGLTYDKTIRISPKDGAPLATRGFTYVRMGEFDRALEDFEAVEKLDRNNARATFGSGLIRCKHGDPLGAAQLAAAEQLALNVRDEFEQAGVLEVVREELKRKQPAGADNYCLERIEQKTEPRLSPG